MNRKSVQKIIAAVCLGAILFSETSLSTYADLQFTTWRGSSWIHGIRQELTVSDIFLRHNLTRLYQEIHPAETGEEPEVSADPDSEVSAAVLEAEPMEETADETVTETVSVHTYSYDVSGIGYS